MVKAELKSLTLPDLPGVYFFLGAKREILYIGKATSLKNRITSYFSKDLIEARSPLIVKMVKEAATVEVTVTDSVLEALILETNLIRSQKPKYNSRSKDDKSYNYLIITNEDLPRVLVVRGKDIAERFSAHDIKAHFGPFPSANSLRIALKIIRRLFRFYDAPVPINKLKSKLEKGQLEFNRALGLYPKVEDAAAYATTIKHLLLFFQGKKQVIIKELERQMLRHAKNEEFEAANQIKKQLFALKHIEDIALIKSDRLMIEPGSYRIEAFDVAHHQGESMVGVMAVIKNGQTDPNSYRRFKLENLKRSNDPEALRQILKRRLGHLEWGQPDIIVVDGNQVQKRTAELAVSQAGLLVPVIAVTKGPDHKPAKISGAKKLIEHYQSEILLANSEAHRLAITFHRLRQRKMRTT